MRRNAGLPDDQLKTSSLVSSLAKKQTKKSGTLFCDHDEFFVKTKDPRNQNCIKVNAGDGRNSSDATTTGNEPKQTKKVNEKFKLGQNELCRNKTGKSKSKDLLPVYQKRSSQIG